MSKVIIVGGGAAGMMAAITAARNGNSVLLLEKNEKLGKKIYITGKGRCNLTNAGDNEDLMNSIVTNRKFMYGAFSRFSNYDCMGFFDELGLKFKVERGNRVFPESDKAADVIDCLRRELRRLNVSVEYETEVKKITAHDTKNPDSDGGTTLVTGVDAITRGKKRHYNEQLDERICRDFEEFRNKQFANSLDKLLPKKMIPVIVGLSGIDPAQKVNSITAASRKQLAQLLKNLTVTLTGVRGFNEAIITQGGIDVKEMQCKKIPNLRFAGEVLDVDAVTGGFNLQVAWSTAYTAGQLGQ